MSDVFAYVPSLPGVSWGRMADYCINTVTPVYHAVKKTLEDDIENITQLMAEMEAHSMEQYEISVCEVSAVLSMPLFRSLSLHLDCAGRGHALFTTGTCTLAATRRTI